jgi:hypothetical protein
MAIREGDVEVYRSGISSLMEAAEQQEAAFYDPITQSMKLGTEIAGTMNTVMNIKPKFDDFMEGIRGESPIGPEGDTAIQSAVSMGNITEGVAREQLGSGYMEGVDYEMDAVTGQYKPAVSMGRFGTTGFDMSVDSPTVPSSMRTYVDPITGKVTSTDERMRKSNIQGAFARVRSEDELQINLQGLKNAATMINDIENKNYFPEGKINIGGMFMSGVNYLRNTFYETDPITGEKRERQ